MKNDTFFNWLIIIVALLLSIGMFSKSLDYWWVPYLVSLVALARYTDFLESKERDEAVVSFRTRRWSEPMSDEMTITNSNYHQEMLDWCNSQDGIPEYLDSKAEIIDGLSESSKWKCNDEDCQCK